MSRSDTGPIQDGSNDPTRIDADQQTLAQLREFANLTAFQRDILQTLANEGTDEAYGLHIKRQLEALYGEEVNHGRLYPNLDTLVEDGLIEKGEIDKRTNSYQLTDRATSLLDEWHAWERGED